MPNDKSLSDSISTVAHWASKRNSFAFARKYVCAKSLVLASSTTVVQACCRDWQSLVPEKQRSASQARYSRR